MIFAALQDLRYELINHQIPQHAIEGLMESAEQYVYDSVSEIATEKLLEALAYAESLDAQEFIDTAEIADFGDSFEIRSTTGKTDFSVAAIPLLPHILSKGKISSTTGNIYQHVAIKEKTRSSFDSQRVAQNAMEAAKAASRSAKGQSTTTAANQALQTFRSQMSANKGKTEYTGNKVWRTATSAQNQLTQWVIPEKKRDMTDFLKSINDELNDSIRYIISNTTRTILDNI